MTDKIGDIIREEINTADEFMKFFLHVTNEADRRIHLLRCYNHILEALALANAHERLIRYPLSRTYTFLWDGVKLLMNGATCDTVLTFLSVGLPDYIDRNKRELEEELEKEFDMSKEEE